MENKICELIKNGYTYSQIVSTLGCSKSLVSYYVNKNGLRKKPFPDTVDWDALRDYYNSGKSIRACKREFNLSPATIRHAINAGIIIKRPVRIPNDAIFIENSNYSNRCHIKNRLVRDFGWEYKCSRCNISDWMGDPIVLQLDHMNGVNNDHRLENLRLLCPNCHSQTDTYCGKNIKVG